jgi:hypothetical protein
VHFGADVLHALWHVPGHVVGSVKAERTHPKPPFRYPARDIFLTARKRFLNFLQGEQMISHIC